MKTKSPGKIVPIRSVPRASVDDKTLEIRWGKKVMDYGYTVFPSVLIQGQRRLGLSPVQLNVLLQLLDHWWKNENLPFPSKKTIAGRMGMSPRYIQKVIGELEDAKLLRRVSRRTRFGDPDTNAYNLEGLIKKIKLLEPDFSAARTKKRRIQRDVETPKGRRRR